MAYVGTPIDTRNQFQSLLGKWFSGDGSTTAFTLDVAPGNVLDIEVFVGNVRQDPNSAYTLSGTTLTFTGAPPSGTNNIYVVHQAKSVGTIDVPDDIISGKTLVTLDNSADHVLIEDATDGELKKALIPSASTVADTFTINGSTPTLTIGDGGAEDTKIVFDGNAADFRIVLDDSEDGLSFGTGESIGTNSAFCIDSQNNVTFGHTPAVGSSTPFMIRGNSAGNTGQQTSTVMNAGILFSEIRSGQTSTWGMGPDGTDFFIQNKTDDPSVNAISINQSEVVSGDFNDTSDVALKENILTITSSINTVKQLRPVTFDWKKTGKGETSGFIAQEVEKLIPNVVKGNNYDASDRLSIGKSINATGVLAHVTKALQEAITKIETLETEMTALKARVTTLEE